MNTVLSIIPFCAPLFQSIAPPFVPAVLFINLLLVNEVSIQVATPVPLRNTAPPRLSAVLNLNIQSSTVPKSPVHSTAPPSPPVTFSPSGLTAYVLPNALLSVKLELSIVPL